MSVVKKFNGLNGCVVSRDDLEKMLIDAQDQEQIELAKRIETVLSHYDNGRFSLDIQEPAFEQLGSGLMGALDLDPYNEEQGLNKAVSPNDILDMITSKMLDMIAASTKAYEKKWKDTGYVNTEDVGKFLVPLNFVSKKAYRGINYMMLSNMGRPLENPYFLTFKQVAALKGNLKKGAVGKEVIYYTKLFTASDKEKGKSISSYDLKKVKEFAETNKIPEDDITSYSLLKYYNVFNGNDIEDIDFKLDQLKVGLVHKDVKAVETAKFPVAEAMIANYPKPSPKFVFGGQQASYNSGTDILKMPVIQDFETMQDYYRTLFHELSHSTGYRTRLARELGNKFGSPKYAKEELIAEFGAVFLSAESGIIWYDNHNHAAYLKSWGRALKAAKDDNKFFISGAAQAQKAYDFVLDFDEKGNPAYFADIAKFEKEKEEKKVVVVPPVAKKPTDYGKKRKFEKTAKKLPFRKEDIPYDTAYRAHTGTSFSPEKRAVMEQNGYYSHLEEVYNENLARAKKLNRIDEFDSKFERYKSGYLKKYLAYLSSRHGLMSTMITGGSKFPVARMNKKNEVIGKRLNELVDYGKYSNFFKPESTIIKTGSDTALDQLKEKLRKEEEAHELTLLYNKIVRRKIDNEAKKVQLKANGFSDKAISSGMSENFKPLPAYVNSNRNARMAELKRKIKIEEDLKEKSKTPVGEIPEIKFDGGTIENDYTDNRIKIFFDDKPSAEIRSWIKKAGHAFKWSPRNGAWQRQLNTYYKGNREDLYKFLGVNVNPSPEPKKETEKNTNPNVEKRRFKQGGTADRMMPNYSNARKNEKEILAFFKKIEEYDDKVLFIEVFENYLYSDQYKTELDFLKAIIECEDEDGCNRILTSIYKSDKENSVKVDKNGQTALFGANKLNAPANKLMQMEFDSLTMDDGWQELIQDPAKNMKIAIWGAPKNGKTSAALQLANYLTKFGSVLYNFVDQGFNKSTKTLWIDSGLSDKSNAVPSDVTTSAELENLLKSGKYTFCFIDMISDFIRNEKMKPEDFKNRFMRQFPNVSFILIFEVTKDGNFKGDQGWTHLVDAIMTVENFLIENRGRYGMGEKIVWEEGFAKFDPKRYAELKAQKTADVPDQEQLEEIKLSFNPIIY